LVAAESPVFEPWLEFHDRYAGYEEPLGRDKAIWGIIHPRGTWIKGRIANVDKEPKEDRWYVTCADVHPSYNYLLDNRGEFLGQLAESFDIKVERDSLINELRSLGKVARLSVQQMKSREAIQVAERIRDNLIPEASDKYYRYYSAHHTVFVEDLELGAWAEAYTVGAYLAQAQR
jgi:hypothetical protein